MFHLKEGLILAILHQYILFANVLLFGPPTVRALFQGFLDEPDLFAVDHQFMVGHEILLTPVLTRNASTVDGAQW